ncbi:MAG: hypothetical protein RIS47_1786, partial [Bacteroidota bacterium]
YGSGHISEFSYHLRTQWVGFEGAPNTQSVLFDTRIATNAGLGLGVLIDNAGGYQSTVCHLGYGYHLRFRGVGVGLGLSLGLKNSLYDPSRQTAENLSDPLLTQGILSSGWIPELNVGVVFHAKNYYVGVSARELLPDASLGGATYESQSELAYSLMGSKAMQISHNNEFQISVLIQYSNVEKLLYVIHGDYQLYETFSTGLGIRHNDALFATFGFKYKSLSVLYAYEYGISSFSRAASSHELALKYAIRAISRCKPVYRTLLQKHIGFGF